MTKPHNPKPQAPKVEPPKTYIAQEGDNWRTVARKFPNGDKSANAERLYNLNGRVNLYPGMVVKLV